MASPTKKEVEDFMKYVLKTVGNDEDKLKEDVVELCEKVLIPICEVCRDIVEKEEIMPERLELLRKNFTDIYRTLKLHLAFYLGLDVANKVTELCKLGQLLELPEELLEKCPEKEWAIDPGSKLLEIFGYIAEYHLKVSKIGSEGHENEVMEMAQAQQPVIGCEVHADEVMEMAQWWFTKLADGNRFRPKVLARVSHDDRCIIGASIAVNRFLRPLCLYNRISQFQLKFKKAIISFQSLDNPDDNDWKSCAFARNDYTEEKAPCQNCSDMFKNLRGFITPETAGGSRTFVANCAEYCPVNQLLTGDVRASSADKLWVDADMERFWKQCSALFDDFEDIIDKCDEAYKSKKPKQLRKVYNQVKHKVHIFGLRQYSF